MTTEKLLKLGFSQKEALVYTTVLKLGQANASDIAKNSDLNRTTIYDILKALIKKGLVSKYKKEGATYFRSLSPDSLMAYLEQEKAEGIKRISKKQQILEKILPELNSIQGLQSKNKPKISFFEGKKGIQTAYEDTLSADGLILAYANVEEMHKTLPNFFPEYYKRRTGKGIHIKTIMPQNLISQIRSKKDSQESRTTKFLPKVDQSFSPEINIYNNKLLFVSWKEKVATLIESKELSDLHKLTFNLLWDRL